MVEISAQYMEFLKANYSGIAGRLDTLMQESPSGSTPEEKQKSAEKIQEEFNSLANDSERVHKYQIWEKVPPILRDRYNGQVPQEVLDAAERDEIYTLRVMEYHPEIKRVEEAREIAEDAQNSIPSAIANTAAAALFVSAIAAGYSKTASTELAAQRLERDNLLAQKEANPNMSEEEKAAWMKAWLSSRQKTADTIKKDWNETQPEKLLVHLLGKFNAGKLNKEELMPQIADLIQKIDTGNRQDKLLEYLKTTPAKAKLGRFKDETLEILANSVLVKIPEAERAQFMKHNIKQKADLPEASQIQALSQNMLSAKANASPDNTNLTAKEKYANMPSVMNRGIQREA